MIGSKAIPIEESLKVISHVKRIDVGIKITVNSQAAETAVLNLPCTA
jgi:hypothetical protein